MLEKFNGIECHPEAGSGSLKHDMWSLRHDMWSLRHDMWSLRHDMWSLRHDMWSLRLSKGLFTALVTYTPEIRLYLTQRKPLRK